MVDLEKLTASAIDPVLGGPRGNHLYYNQEDFFRNEVERGEIFLRDGQRAAKVTEGFINGLHLGVEEEVGAASALMMYRCGQAWGLQDMKRFAARMRQEFGGGKREIWSMHPNFVWEQWWWPLTVTGFGAWSFDLSYEEQDLAVIEIRNSAVATSMSLLGKPVCHLYAGMFAGVFSFYDKDARDSIEIQCYSMGNDACKFLVGPKDRINAAEFWRQEGATAGEIMSNLNR